VVDAIFDTGPIVGALDRDDQWHEWAAARLAEIRQAAITCEAVISEACFLLRDVEGAREKLLTMVESGVLRIEPVFPEESPAVRGLLERYGTRMDYADACLVRLSELHRRHVVVTTDATDFRLYLRFTRQALPLLLPD
jgi:uncharacterized protein